MRRGCDFLLRVRGKYTERVINRASLYVRDSYCLSNKCSYNCKYHFMRSIFTSLKCIVLHGHETQTYTFISYWAPFKKFSCFWILFSFLIIRYVSRIIAGNRAPAIFTNDLCICSCIYIRRLLSKNPLFAEKKINRYLLLLHQNSIFVRWFSLKFCEFQIF